MVGVKNSGKAGDIVYGCPHLICIQLTVVSSSCRTWSYSDMATQKMIAVTSSKQWIHFFRSERWPPTSNNLEKKGKHVNWVTYFQTDKKFKKPGVITLQDPSTRYKNLVSSIQIPGYRTEPCFILSPKIKTETWVFSFSQKQKLNFESFPT